MQVVEGIGTDMSCFPVLLLIQPNIPPRTIRRLTGGISTRLQAQQSHNASIGSHGGEDDLRNRKAVFFRHVAQQGKSGVSLVGTSTTESGANRSVGSI